jgi:hypothetical protein
LREYAGLEEEGEVCVCGKKREERKGGLSVSREPTDVEELTPVMSPEMEHRVALFHPPALWGKYVRWLGNVL